MSEEMLVEEENLSVEEEMVPVEETAPAEEKADAAVATEVATEESKKPDFRELIKKPLFWGITAGAVILVCTLVFVMVALSKSADHRWSFFRTTESTKNAVSDAVPDADSDAIFNTIPEETYLPIDRNPIGPSDFYTNEDGYLTCLVTPSVLGIDVSEWQGGDIDWQKVKEAGVEFVLIRVGWRGSEQGVLTADTYAQSNYAGASAAGIKVGAYIFSQAITPDEAVEEAQYLLDAVKDWNIEMPLVFDWEYIDATSRTANMDPRTLTDCAIAFCETIKKAGHTPMIYFNTNQSMEMLYLVELDEYLFWLAQYDTVLRYDYKIDMWQYTESGTVPGINVPVDINLYFPYEE